MSPAFLIFFVVSYLTTNDAASFYRRSNSFDGGVLEDDSERGLSECQEHGHGTRLLSCRVFKSWATVPRTCNGRICKQVQKEICSMRWRRTDVCSRSKWRTVQDPSRVRREMRPPVPSRTQFMPEKIQNRLTKEFEMPKQRTKSDQLAELAKRVQRYRQRFATATPTRYTKTKAYRPRVEADESVVAAASADLASHHDGVPATDAANSEAAGFQTDEINAAMISPTSPSIQEIEDSTEAATSRRQETPDHDGSENAVITEAKTETVLDQTSARKILTPMTAGQHRVSSYPPTNPATRDYVPNGVPASKQDVDSATEAIVIGTSATERSTVESMEAIAGQIFESTTVIGKSVETASDVVSGTRQEDAASIEDDEFIHEQRDHKTDANLGFRSRPSEKESTEYPSQKNIGSSVTSVGKGFSENSGDDAHILTASTERLSATTVADKSSAIIITKSTIGGSNGPGKYNSISGTSTVSTLESKDTEIMRTGTDSDATNNPITHPEHQGTEFREEEPREGTTRLNSIISEDSHAPTSDAGNVISAASGVETSDGEEEKSKKAGMNPTKPATHAPKSPEEIRGDSKSVTNSPSDASETERDEDESGGSDDDEASLKLQFAESAEVGPDHEDLIMELPISENMKTTRSPISSPQSAIADATQTYSTKLSGEGSSKKSNDIDATKTSILTSGSETTPLFVEDSDAKEVREGSTIFEGHGVSSTDASSPRSIDSSTINLPSATLGPVESSPTITTTIDEAGVQTSTKRIVASTPTDASARDFYAQSTTAKTGIAQDYTLTSAAMLRPITTTPETEISSIQTILDMTRGSSFPPPENPTNSEEQNGGASITSSDALSSPLRTAENGNMEIPISDITEPSLPLIKIRADTLTAPKTLRRTSDLGDLKSSTKSLSDASGTSLDGRSGSLDDDDDDDEPLKLQFAESAEVGSDHEDLIMELPISEKTRNTGSPLSSPESAIADTTQTYSTKASGAQTSTERIVSSTLPEESNHDSDTRRTTAKTGIAEDHTRTTTAMLNPITATPEAEISSVQTISEITTLKTAEEGSIDVSDSDITDTSLSLIEIEASTSTASKSPEKIRGDSKSTTNSPSDPASSPEPAIADATQGYSTQVSGVPTSTERIVTSTLPEESNRDSYTRRSTAKTGIAQDHTESSAEMLKPSTVTPQAEISNVHTILDMTQDSSSSARGNPTSPEELNKVSSIPSSDAVSTAFRTAEEGTVDVSNSGITEPYSSLIESKASTSTASKSLEETQDDLTSVTNSPLDPVSSQQSAIADTTQSYSTEVSDEGSSSNSNGIEASVATHTSKRPSFQTTLPTTESRTGENGIPRDNDEITPLSGEHPTRSTAEKSYSTQNVGSHDHVTLVAAESPERASFADVDVTVTSAISRVPESSTIRAGLSDDMTSAKTSSWTETLPVVVTVSIADSESTATATENSEITTGTVMPSQVEADKRHHDDSTTSTEISKYTTPPQDSPIRTSVASSTAGPQPDATGADVVINAGESGTQGSDSLAAVTGSRISAKTQGEGILARESELGEDAKRQHNVGETQLTDSADTSSHAQPGDHEELSEQPPTVTAKKKPENVETTEISGSTGMATDVSGSTGMATEISGSTGMDTETSGSTEIATDISGTTAMATGTSGSTGKATEISGSTGMVMDISRSTAMGTEISGSTGMATDITGSTGIATDVSGSTRMATDLSGSTVMATEISGSTVIATEILGSTGTAADVSGSTEMATKISESTAMDMKISGSTGMATDISESTVMATDVSGSTGMATKISESTAMDMEISGSTGIATDVSESTGMSTDISESTGMATDVSENTRMATEISGNTRMATETSGSTGMATDVSGSTVMATDVSGSTGMATDVSGSTGIVTGISESAGMVTEIYGSTSLATETSESTEMVTDVSGSTGMATEISGSTAVTTEISGNTGMATDISESTVLATHVSGSTGMTTDVSGSTGMTKDVSGSTGMTTDLSGSTDLTTDVSGSTEMATEISESTAMKTEISGSTGMATEVSGSARMATEIFGSTGMATEISGSTGMATDISGSAGMATDISRSTGMTTEISGSTAMTTEISGSTGTATEISGSTRMPTETSGSTGMATDVSGSTVMATAVSGSTGMATDASGSTGTATHISESTGMATDISESAGMATGISGSTGMATGVSENTGMATEISGSTRMATETSESTEMATDVSGSTGMATDISGSTGMATQISGSTAVTTEISGSTVMATDVSESTGMATDVPGSTGMTTDVSGSSGMATETFGSMVMTTEISGSTGTATDASGSTGMATDLSGGTVMTTEISGSTVVATEIPGRTGTAADVSGSTKMATEISESTAMKTNISGSTRTVTEISGSTRTATEVSGSTATATDVSGSTGMATDVSGSTGMATEISGGTKMATDVFGSTGMATDLSGSTVLASEISGSTVIATEIPGSTGMATDVSGSTDMSTVVSGNTEIATEISESTAMVSTPSSPRTSVVPEKLPQPVENDPATESMIDDSIDESASDSIDYDNYYRQIDYKTDDTDDDFESSPETERVTAAEPSQFAPPVKSAGVNNHADEIDDHEFVDLSSQQFPPLRSSGDQSHPLDPTISSSVYIRHHEAAGNRASRYVATAAVQMLLIILLLHCFLLRRRL